MITIADAAVAYSNRGWKPIPVDRKTKKARGKDWQKRPYDPAQFDGNAQNVAVQLGNVSGGLVDVDLDTMLAVGLAPDFLSPTSAIFGRRSKPASHQLYLSDLHKTENTAAIAYREYCNGQPGATLVELRIGANGKGATTVFPPSMHVTGERVTWVCDGEPARVDGAVLKHAVLKLAVACLLQPRYPGPGSRHEGSLVLGGVLARAGWAADDIGHLVEVLARAAGDDDVRDRVETAVGALNVKANGHDVAGFGRLREVWGDDAATTLGKWFAWSEQRVSQAKGANGEDAIALRFAEHHADDLRYVAAWGRWLEWNGKHWDFDDTLRAFDLARLACREARKHDAKTVAAVERLAKSDRRLASVIDQWDADPWALNTPNGVVDLRTGMMRAARTEDYCTNITAVAPSGECPIWLAFLQRATGEDDELIAFLQRICGYALTGVTREHALFFLYGTGANGKSVFISTVAGILADYHTTSPIETFTASQSERHPTDLAGLRGARLVTAVETEEGRRWAESKIKALTGGDKISARFMRQDFFEFTPAFKLIIAGNHKPGLRSVDEAIRRRLHLIPFNVTIPPAERDLELTEKLKAEWPAILRWMIEGCLEWQSTGLQPPKIVTDATAAYLAAEDALAEWMDECCERDPFAWSASSTLFASWTAWATKAGEPIGSQKRFVQALEARGLELRREKSIRGFRGVRATCAT